MSDLQPSQQQVPLMCDDKPTQPFESVYADFFSVEGNPSSSSQTNSRGGLLSSSVVNFIYAPELFPTAIRTRGMAFLNTIGHAGFICAPLVTNILVSQSISDNRQLVIARVL
ncbi:hypothetical protein SK128_010511 [Halocaridina rubra]|uniref:Major facilitator superfamily (MFS) profile domain-containing protein n=1 Tax=Halocaridina rubra TaxID=373956 RepID=A0AAN8X492_HALRR